MFGNRRLPNIAPSLLLCLPPHSRHHRLLRPPCERPHGLSNGVLIADADAHQPRHVTVADGRHVTGFRRSPRPPHHSYRPPLVQGFGRAHCRHRRPPTPTNHATSLAFDGPRVRHTAATAPPLVQGSGRTTSGTSPTGSRKGKQEREGEERDGEGEAAGGEEGLCAPSCSVILEASEAACIPHAASFDLPDTNEEACIPHASSFDFLDTNEAGCIPHAASFDPPDASEPVCVPHTGSFDLPDASEAVCIPHAASFDLPDTNEAGCIPHPTSFDPPDPSEPVCVPHTGSFDLPDPSEAACIPHAASFDPPDPSEAVCRQGQRETHTLPLVLLHYPPLPP